MALTIKEIPDPTIGQKIYIPSSFHVYRGADDFVGGMATINKIEYSKTLPKDHFNYIFVGIEGERSSMYNYKSLMSEQQELSKRYAGMIAHTDPDLDPEFNQPDADWVSVK